MNSDTTPSSKLPPTERQLNRIKELKNRPELTNHLDNIVDAIENRGMISTMGQAGILINWMKQKIREEGGSI